ncbi:MAG: UvrD-helicase domain-containing protein, partial [Actinomycetota bacterium]|nr:UvrD-helicase domain-containing protein [Actinomycetota bacterium]
MPRPLDGLNASQRAAVTHPGGPLLVVGGAGTGKTRVVVRRFAWLIERGLAPGAVLALACSAPTAAAMRACLEKIVERPYDELWASTFEAFCARLLREEALEAGLDPFFAPASRADRVALLLDRVDALALRRHEIRGNPAPLVASFVRRIDRLKEELAEATDFRRHAEGLAAAADAEAARAHAERELEFARVFAEHDRLLSESGALDAGDLVLHAIRLLREKPHVRERVGDRFRHVLVDEYEEANAAHDALVGLLAGEQRNLTVAVDEDQAIRRAAAGARPNAAGLRRRYPDATIVRLRRRHRFGG